MCREMAKPGSAATHEGSAWPLALARTLRPRLARLPETRGVKMEGPSHKLSHHFPHRETEAWRGEVTRPRSQSKRTAEAGPGPSPASRAGATVTAGLTCGGAAGTPGLSALAARYSHLGRFQTPVSWPHPTDREPDTERTVSWCREVIMPMRDFAARFSCGSDMGQPSSQRTRRRTPEVLPAQTPTGPRLGP